MCMKINAKLTTISFALFVVIVHLFFTSFITEITKLTLLTVFIGRIISVLFAEKTYLEESNSKEKI